MRGPAGCREQDLWPCSGALKEHLQRELGELPALAPPAAPVPEARPVKLGAPTLTCALYHPSCAHPPTPLPMATPAKRDAPVLTH